MTLVAHRWKSRAKFVWYRSDAAQARRAQLCCHLAPQVARLLQPHHSTAEPRALARFATARLGARRVAAEHGAAEHVAAELGAAEHSAAKSIAAKCVAVGGADGHSPGERVACSQHGRAEHDPAEHGPAEHGPAEHGPGEHGAAKHGTAIAREQSTPLPQLRSTSPWLLCALHSGTQTIHDDSSAALDSQFNSIAPDTAHQVVAAPGGDPISFLGLECRIPL